MENKKLKAAEKRSLWKDETGDIGVKQIAITVGVIVIIAAAVSLITGNLLQTWINDLWTYLFEDLIQDNIGGGS